MLGMQEAEARHFSLQLRGQGSWEALSPARVQGLCREEQEPLEIGESVTLFQYVEAHPWWTLLYLLVICGSFSGLIRITINKVRGKS